MAKATSVGEFNVRTLEDEKLTPNSVLIQDIPVSVIGSTGGLVSAEVKMVTCHLKETKKMIPS